MVLPTPPMPYTPVLLISSLPSTSIIPFLIELNSCVKHFNNVLPNGEARISPNFGLDKEFDHHKLRAYWSCDLKKATVVCGTKRRWTVKIIKSGLIIIHMFAIYSCLSCQSLAFKLYSTKLLLNLFNSTFFLLLIN